MSRFLTLKEVAHELKCSVPTIRAWQRHGLPVHHFGWLVRADLQEVLAWLETYKPNRRLTLEQARAATPARQKTKLEPKTLRRIIRRPTTPASA